MKFLLLVEGTTEGVGVPGFLNRWLNKFCMPGKNIGVQNVKYEGWPDLYRDAPKKTRLLHTAHDSDEIIAVVSLLDLYGPTFYPDDKVTIADRYAWGCEHMEQRVRDHFAIHKLPAPKYRHFFAVHETEAWLLTRPDLFHRAVQRPLSNQKPPEQINFKTPPSMLLEDLYYRETKHRYQKVAMGRNLFPKLDPNDAGSACPYLQRMLNDLKAMAVAAGALPEPDTVGDPG